MLKGNLAADGALIKVAGLKSSIFEGAARIFECEEDAFAAVMARSYSAGDLLVSRNEGQARTLQWLADEAEIARRRAAWKPRPSERLAGVLQKYAKRVGPAHLGAVAHSGAVQ